LGHGLVARGVSFRRQEDFYWAAPASPLARPGPAGLQHLGARGRAGHRLWTRGAAVRGLRGAAAAGGQPRPAAAAASRLGSALRGRTGRAAARRRSWNRPRALRIQTRRCVFAPAERTGNLREGGDSIRGRGPGGAAGAGAAGPGPRVPSWWSGERGRGRCRRRSAGGVRRLCHDEMALRARRPPGRPPIAEMA
jgi:hypothetical protein